MGLFRNVPYSFNSASSDLVTSPITASTATVTLTTGNPQRNGEWAMQLETSPTSSVKAYVLFGSGTPSATNYHAVLSRSGSISMTANSYTSGQINIAFSTNDDQTKLSFFIVQSTVNI